MIFPDLRRFRPHRAVVEEQGMALVGSAASTTPPHLLLAWELVFRALWLVLGPPCLSPISSVFGHVAANGPSATASVDRRAITASEPLVRDDVEVDRVGLLPPRGYDLYLLRGLPIRDGVVEVHEPYAGLRLLHELRGEEVEGVAREVGAEDVDLPQAHLLEVRAGDMYGLL